MSKCFTKHQDLADAPECRQTNRMHQTYWWNAIAGPAHAASLPALCAPALGPDSPLGPVTLWHVTGALLFLVRHGASKAAVILQWKEVFE